jgi:hypothetical protein
MEVSRKRLAPAVPTLEAGLVPRKPADACSNATATRREASFSGRTIETAMAAIREFKPALTAVLIDRFAQAIEHVLGSIRLASPAFLSP